MQIINARMISSSTTRSNPRLRECVLLFNSGSRSGIVEFRKSSTMSPCFGVGDGVANDNVVRVVVVRVLKSDVALIFCLAVQI